MIPEVTTSGRFFFALEQKQKVNFKAAEWNTSAFIVLTNVQILSRVLAAAAGQPHF